MDLQRIFITEKVARICERSPQHAGTAKRLGEWMLSNGKATKFEHWIPIYLALARRGKRRRHTDQTVVWTLWHELEKRHVSYFNDNEMPCMTRQIDRIYKPKEVVK